jgi:hypothetical protein
MTNELKGLTWITATIAAMGMLTHIVLALRP